MKRNPPVQTRRSMDAASLLRWSAFCHRDLRAVSDGVRECDFGTLADRGERLANALDGLGVPRDARVGILSENRTEYIEADVGIAFARRVRVALNARLHLDDHLFAAADSEIQILLHSRGFAAEAESLRESLGIRTICFDEGAGGDLDYTRLLEANRSTSIVRDGSVEDPAWITYTSGTTGRPKGIVLSQRSIREVALNLLIELGPVRPGDRIVLPQQLSHGAGYFALPWLMSGGCLYVLRRFDPEEVLAARRSGATNVLKCVPAMVPPLLEVASGALGYDTLVYGAAPMPRPVLGAALDAFGPILMQIYGQSEAPITLTCLHKSDHQGDGEQRFSAGRPFRGVGVEVRADDGTILPIGTQGEVAVTGSHIMSHYHRLPDETAAVLREGWVMTRDVGVIDERGFVYLRGRRDEMINSGGFNISPREVERVLSEYPNVEEVAVVGVPDDRWGQAVSAAVKMCDGCDGEPDKLIAFVRPRLGFRSPKTIRFVDAIPKNAYGKVDRQQLLAAFSDTKAVQA